MDCIFCKIGSGSISCFKVLEDEHTLAFLDIKPQTLGHTVVIPKAHAETIFDMDDSAVESMAVFVKKVMKQLDRLHPDGFNTGWNHLKAGGQVVPHLHLHILPRYAGDGGGSMHSIVHNPGRRSLEEVTKILR